MRWAILKWNNLVREREKWADVVGTVMNFGVPSNTWNVLTSWGTNSFSGKKFVPWE